MTNLTKQPPERKQVEAELARLVDDYMLQRDLPPNAINWATAINHMWPVVSQSFPQFPWEPGHVRPDPEDRTRILLGWTQKAALPGGDS